jgi:hypothetical protein
MKLLKYAFGILFCNAFRFLRFIPNGDPIMGCMLPFSKQGNWWQGALFALLAMVSFDIITMKLGIWTVATALTYAGLGIMFHFAYRRIGKVKLRHYLGSGIAGVLIFDFVTGILLGPAMFGMSYAQAIVGQIPFTAMHLLTVTFFVLLLTPLIDRAIISNPSFEDSAVFNRIKLWAGA